MPLHKLAAVAATGLLVAACGGPGNDTKTIDFGSASQTPGMAGHGNAGKSQVPAATGETASPAQIVPAAPAGPNSVTIDNFEFGPKALTVPVGTTVTWTNRDEEPHNIVAEDNSFHSPGLDAGDSYTFTFKSAGTFKYVCGIHPFMHGTVVVTK